MDSDGSGLRRRGQIVHWVSGRRRGGPVGGGVLLRRVVCHTGVYNIECCGLPRGVGEHGKEVWGDDHGVA